MHLLDYIGILEGTVLLSLIAYEEEMKANNINVISKILEPHNNNLYSKSTETSTGVEY